MSGPVTCANFTRFDAVKASLPEPVVGTTSWNRSDARSYFLVSGSGRRWELNDALRLGEVDPVVRPPAIAPTAPIIGLSTHPTGVLYFTAQGGVVLETRSGLETFVFPHGEIMTGSYIGGLIDRWILVLNQAGELYLHAIGTESWEPMPALGFAPGPNVQLTLAGESSPTEGRC